MDEANKAYCFIFIHRCLLESAKSFVITVTSLSCIVPLYSIRTLPALAFFIFGVFVPMYMTVSL